MNKDDTPRPTKERLIRSAANLFRKRGYNGVGLSDLLSDAHAPKGSLYHHFPNGKSDLAVAAATWASDHMLRLIAVCFDDARSFDEGVTTLCFKLAKLFDQTDHWDACPIGSTLFEGPDNTAFRDLAERLYDGWIAEAQCHAQRFGQEEAEAAKTAEHMFILIQGGWLLARARRSSDVLRRLPEAL